MRPTITAFANSPDEGQGLARDMRVRWALEEAGQPYDVRLVTFAEMKQPAHMALQPFGQIPTYEDGEHVLFETGAIALHIAERSPVLLPVAGEQRGRAVAWLFAALNTIEPPIVEREQVEYIEAERSWLDERRPLLDDRIRTRLRPLQSWLGDREWLERDFTIGDLMMVMVLRRMDGMGILEQFPNLFAYVERGTSRPAYEKAFAAQHEVFVQARQKGEI